MRDLASVSRVQLLHPIVRNDVKTVIESIESLWPKTMAIRIVQGLRTFEEQNSLYAQGRTKPGQIVTAAKGGQSYHNYGLAIDFALLYDKDNNGNYEALSWDMAIDYNSNHEKDWQEVVNAFKKAGWEWGGDWRKPDNPHFQKRYGHPQNPTDLLTAYNARKFIPNTKYVLI